jgi:hypothetical protein
MFILVTGGNANPAVWVEQAQRKADPSQLVGMEPEALSSLEAEFSFYLRNLESGIGTPCFSEPTTIFHSVYCFVTSKIAYGDDKRVYYGLDYLATPSEALLMGRDDCDGKAVVICTMLAARGYDAYVVMGTKHTWVEVKTDDSYVYISYIDAKNPVIITGEQLPDEPTWYVRFNAKENNWRPHPLLIQGVLVWLYLVVAMMAAYHVYAHRLYSRPLTYISEMAGYFKYLLYMVLFIFGIWLSILLFLRLIAQMP